ncbi:hypothetical protein [Solirubrum puertoriconensis]|uniref:Phage tail protein n=1 Tax=Solirubrum puertoriconensis TaxID=1751427 RepID=A0A9X0L3U6_SOLP1|nr:hypothetical protein [Solirubrum puertoriconensis]KUG06891.1 hypothetical protein ASU33_06080 [Solirubrum puertoriconensis]
MTHADLTHLLEQLAMEAGAKSFWHGKQTAKDINYNAPFPQAHLFLMPSQLREQRIRTQVTMCFYGADKHENGNADSIVIQDAMDLLTQRFYSLFADLTEVELVDGAMDRTPVLRQGAAIGTGYVVSFTLSHYAQC